MNILGLDAALLRTGWAILTLPTWKPGALPVSDFILEQSEDGIDPYLVTGVIKNKSQARAKQLELIYRELNGILDDYHVDYAFIEEPGKWARGAWNSSQKTIEALAQARAIMLLACQQRGIPTEQVGTNDVKTMIAYTPGWKGGIPKERVQAVLRTLGLYYGDDEDVADAVSIAYVGAKLLYVDQQEQHHKIAQKKSKK